MKIVVTAGGTMGHIQPALAIIEEFQKREKDLEVIYIGTHNRMEKDIIPKKGYRYIPLEIYGFSKDIFLDVKNFFCIKKAEKICGELFRKEHIDVVIGVGGYVTYPVLKMAHKMHIKTFIHEQNSIPGKSNKMISKYADLIGITFLESKKYFKTKGRILYTGHPCGAWALNVPKKNKETLGFTKGKKLVTIVAGSLGSGSLNEKMIPFLEEIQQTDYEICYITGKSHYEEFCKHHFQDNVKVFPYMDELPGLLKISDVVVSRAGAGSLSEILALKVPAIIIPSPNVANNHQFYNAKELEKKGCILLLEEKNLTKESLKENIDLLLHQKQMRFRLIQNMQNENVEKSSAIIYEEIRKML